MNPGEKAPISLQEFAEKFFSEMMKNTFHADFIEWMSNELKEVPKGLPILMITGRKKAYNPAVFKGINGIHATRIVIDEAKFAEDCLIQESCSSFRTGRCSKQCKLYI